MHPLLVRTRPILGRCPECSGGFTERVDHCSVCEAEIEWCESCGKQITEDNALVEWEQRCESCAEYPCMRCGNERPADGVDEDGFSALAMEEMEEAWMDRFNRVCGRCMWEDRNP